MREMFPKSRETIRKAIAEATEPTWNDWYTSRVYFLTNWAKEPRKDANAIAKREMALLRRSEK